MKNHSSTQVTKGYVMTALLKLSDRFASSSLHPSDEEKRKLEGLLALHDRSLQLELQQRSCEFMQVLAQGEGGREGGGVWDAKVRGEVLGRIPALDEMVLRARRGGFREEGRDGRMERKEMSESAVVEILGMKGGTEGGGRGEGGQAAVGDLLDLEDIFGGAPPAAAGNGSLRGGGSGGTSQIAPSGLGNGNGGGGIGGGGGDLLSDIFSSSASISTSAPAAGPPPFDDVFGMQQQSQQHHQPQEQPTAVAAALAVPAMAASPVMPRQAASSITAFDKDGLLITMDLSKPDQGGDPASSLLLCRFHNQTGEAFTNLSFQCAVPKYVKLEMSSASGSTLPAHSAGAVTQVVKVSNSMLGQKPLQLKIKVTYTNAQGQPVTEMGTVANFPDGH